MVNYRPQKILGLLAPTHYARVTRLSPSFFVRAVVKYVCMKYYSNLLELFYLPKLFYCIAFLHVLCIQLKVNTYTIVVILVL